MRSLSVAEGHQLPLIHVVYADDEQLLNTLEGEWFEILHAFAWQDYRSQAAAYYEALYGLNREEGEAATGADLFVLKFMYGQDIIDNISMLLLQIYFPNQYHLQFG